NRPCVSFVAYGGPDRPPRGAMTPDSRVGSHFFAWIGLVISTSYAAAAPKESCLGVADTGIFGDLDAKVQLALPDKLAPERVSAKIDREHHVVVLSIDGYPRKAYPLGGTSKLAVGHFELVLRPGDARELAPLLREARVAEAVAEHDRDHDGIPDPLDVLIGAK